MNCPEYSEMPCTQECFIRTIHFFVCDMHHFLYFPVFINILSIQLSGNLRTRAQLHSRGGSGNSCSSSSIEDLCSSGSQHFRLSTLCRSTCCGRSSGVPQYGWCLACCRPRWLFPSYPWPPGKGQHRHK